MVVSWGTIKSLAIFFGPVLLPKAIGYYRSLRNASHTSTQPVRPVPPKVFRALIVLAVVVCVFLLKALPIFGAENVFTRTQSRLQIPADVLFTRLSSLRPDNTLTEQDTALRAKFVNLESRLLYLQYGPDVLADCPFCNSEDPRSYFYYAVPALVTPHIANLVLLSLATSGLLIGREGARWRSYVVMAAGIIAAGDIYLVGAYGYQANARATRLPDLDMFYWRARSYRLLALALLDGAFAALLYLSSTNRLFAAPFTPTERVETVTRGLLGTKSKLNALGIVKNTAIRDEELRARMEAYWQHEGRLMREVMEEREVLEGVNDALSNRINMQGITGDAETYALNILPLPPQPPAPETTVG